MKLKTMTVKDADGNDVVVGMLDKDGHPVFEVDGKELGMNVRVLRDDLRAANAEATGRRKDVEKLEAQVALFEGIDPEKARKALETMANLDAGQLLTADKVEDLKKQIGKSYEESFVKKEESYSKKIEGLEAQVQDRDASIVRLLVKGAFDASPFIREHTNLPSEMAYTYFGRHFTPEKTDNGDFRVVARINNEPIFSSVRPGQLAEFEEAIEVIIGNYQFKDRILRASQAAGGGAPPGGGAPAGGAKTPLQALKEQHAAALKAQDLTLAVALKKQIFEAEKAAATP